MFCSYILFYVCVCLGELGRRGRGCETERAEATRVTADDN